MSVRLAVLFASADKYVTTVISLATTVVVSRIISPHEFGISVIGGAALAVAGAVRELGSVAFIVQSPDLSLARLRTVTTINFLAIAVLSVVLLFAAPWIAEISNAPEVVLYIRVALISLVTGIVVLPIYGLLSRDMKFRSIAVVNIISSLVNSGVLLGTALAGASYLSFAIAQSVSAVVALVLLVALRPAFEIFRPTLSAWRDVLSFSMYSSGTAMLGRSAEYLMLLILGTILTPSTLGLLQRAALICGFPESTVLAGANAVALPAFSERARSGADLGQSYRAALSRITVIIWPIYGLFLILAYPMIAVMLGPDWMETAPLVSILAGALAFNFLLTLNATVMIAMGAVRRVFLLSVIHIVIGFPIVAYAAQFGVQAVAWSMYIVVWSNVVISVSFLAKIVKLPWPDLLKDFAKSSGVTACALLGPGIVYYVSGGAEQISIPGAALAVGLSGIGWLAALKLVNHDALDEIKRVIGALVARINRPKPGEQRIE